MPKKDEKIQFKGFISPRYTQVPDELFDDLMSHLSGAELKVLLYIIRRTFGFKKDVDNISLSQICTGIITREGEILDKGTGLSQQSVITALKGLIKINAIVSIRRSSKEKGYEATTYSLNLIPFSNKLSTPSPKIREALLQKLEIQETVLQETDLQNRNSSIKISTNRSDYNKSNTNFSTIGELLKKKNKQGKIAPKDLPESVKVTVQKISDEFGEPRNAHSNLTRISKIIEESGKNKDSFTSYLYEARSITKQQSKVKKKMPYFFEVLKDIVGMKTNGNFLR